MIKVSSKNNILLDLNDPIQYDPIDQYDPIQYDPTHCWECNKRVGLLGFKCRCDYVFCGKHRHSDQHECTFNYREHHRNVLEKKYPKLVSSKINKI